MSAGTFIIAVRPATTFAQDESEIRAMVTKLKNEAMAEIRGNLPPTPNQGNDQSQAPIGMDPSASGVPQIPGVLLHARGRAGGTAFPSPAESQGILLSPDVFAAWQQEVQAATNEALQPTGPPQLPDCGRGGTVKTPGGFDAQTMTPEQVRFYESQVFLDQLFIRGESPPKNATAEFGTFAEVRIVSSNAAGGEAYGASGFGAECLPFRIRVTGKYVFRHTGDDALRNYDFDPNGTGQNGPPPTAVATQQKPIDE